MNQIDIYFNNLKNALIEGNKCYQIVRWYKNAFLIWYTSIFNIIIESINVNPCYQTNLELWSLHQWFSYLSIKRLHILIDRSGHNIDFSLFEYLIKYCYYCQKYGKSPRKFSFTLNNDADFNYHIIIAIMYLASSFVLHVISKTICL